MNLDPIRQYIQIQILDDVDTQIGTDEDLLLTEVLDSLSVMRLVAYLEEIQAIRIPPEDVTLENFRTLRLIGAYLDRRKVTQIEESASSGPVL